ncbi:TPA: hypothetical protein QDA74_003362 [Burkholderia territorii]|uniref:hypothetical protein n=1 Tax=Burkholderia territorii TaxID=1503055 RepID=UPI0011C933DD|nr:hypothetical protein [Burkholderia territorii]TXG16217.1 hypothetical protein FU139_14120 [Burkholderia territorii]HDR8859947.1 hypothetical protein [Burkholderia territorii]HDR8867619.1 hypothetical protein [Burkholderia territorii]HDR8873593.1 hypothetical protein [Burkholderia territorii]HDR8877866.1 hypothetical protein [Burkholderia territorii]
MADVQQKDNVLGTGAGMLTPTGYKDRPKVAIQICDKHVTPAPKWIVGTCPFYYRPLHGAYLETVEKVSMSSVWSTIKAFALSWDPWTDSDVAHKLLHRRERLIEPESSDSDWSRHGNFMMRHIGCGHKPPDYYISYGYYYCSDYGANLYPRLSPQGKAWLNKARKLLQVNMEDGLNQNMMGDTIQMASPTPGNGGVDMKWPQFELEMNTEKFKEFAFKTHPMAYLDGGLADLPIMDLVRIGTRPNIQEWGDGRTWGQAVDSAIPVLRNKAEAWDVDDPVGKALGRLLVK